MVSDDFIGYRFKETVRAKPADDPGFFTDSPDPFVFAHRLVHGFPGFSAFKMFGVQILPAAKEGTEQETLSMVRVYTVPKEKSFPCKNTISES
jgi:hypothetical protein